MEQTDKERIEIPKNESDRITESGHDRAHSGDENNDCGYKDAQISEIVFTEYTLGREHEYVYIHETQVIPLRERLEKVEKALKDARDVLVMASLIDKSSTCMNAVNEIDQLLTKEG